MIELSDGGDGDDADDDDEVRSAGRTSTTYMSLIYHYSLLSDTPSFFNILILNCLL